MLTCPACGFAENPPVARFCAACATPLRNREPAREERKIVTVLFCDLVGFTQRSESLDPEDVRALLRTYHDRLRGELERFGGTVEKFIGDAVVAVFGAPASHEDDPERAVRAALAIRDWAREDEHVQVRIAINTGEALVSLDARPEQGEGMVAGDVVNTAARLQAAAPVNSILVGQMTYRATQQRIDYNDAAPVEAKGKPDLIPVWEVAEARSRVDVERPSSVALVGRDDELRQLHQTLARVTERREPQLVTLVGVPGIGKSRLVYELFRSIEQGSELVYWRRGRSPAYGEGVSFWALGEIVKAQAGILESDSAGAAHEKLRATVEALVEESDAAWVTGHLGPLVGLEAARELAGDRQEEAFAAWRRFLEALAEERPLVLVFEDLHWADDGMLDFVEHAVDWADGVPLLVVCTARPELLERRPSWGGGKVNSATVPLAPLTDDDTARLVHALLGRSVLPAELQATVLGRAGGNPLYAEEFVRLVENERHDVTVPESVQGIIAARLDVLKPEEKHLLQDAAVAGRAFWLGELASIGDRDAREVERSLHGLARREFVQRERRSSVAGETQYAFRHALVRDVAYGQIPRADRADKHRRAAEWIETLGRAEDHAEMLAHHYLSALEYARAAGGDVGRLVEPARRTFRDAGERALALHAFSSAIRFFEAALELWTKDDPPQASLAFSLATALHRSGDLRAEVELERAADLLVASGDRERAAEARTMLAEVAWHGVDRERCDAELGRARELVRDATPSASVARVLSEVSRYRALAGHYDQAIDLGRAALAMAEELALEEVKAHALNNIGMARAMSGDLGGIDDLERSIEVALAVNSPEAARGYNNLASVLVGDTERKVALFSEAVRVAERFGLVRMGRFTRGVLLSCEYEAGRWDEYLAHTEEFIAESDRLGGSYQDIYILSHRARIAIARGADEQAVVHTQRALALARAAPDPQVLIPTLSDAAWVELDLGRRQEAQAHAIEAIETAAGTRFVEWLAGIALFADRLAVQDELRSVLCGAASATPEAKVVEYLLEGAYDRAADVLNEEGGISDIVLAAHARLRAGEKLAAQGRRAEADEQLYRALAFFRSVRATRYIQEGEGLLAATA